MTEEKKDESNEQQEYLSGHEELLKSIHAKTETPEEQPEAVEPIEETPEVIEKEDPIPEVQEPEATEEAPVTQSVSESKNPVSASRPNKLGGKKKKKGPTQPQHSQQHEELLKKQALEQREVTEVLVFLKKYTKPAATAIIVICVIVLVQNFFKTQHDKKETVANMALMNATSAGDLEGIIQNHPSTDAVPMAMMRLARERFNAGQTDEAETLYTEFTQKYSQHELFTQAELNLIACKEAKGQLEEAQTSYGAFAKKYAASFLAPSALMSQARCLETLGKLDEARIVYEDIKVNFAESLWAVQAEANLTVVLGKM